jgi:hypothetical protein
MPLLRPIPGETPIDDLSGLKVKGIKAADAGKYEALIRLHQQYTSQT